MTTTDEDDCDSSAKAELLEYLQRACEDLRCKLEGLSEHDLRRPLVPSAARQAVS